jgi:cytochrome P450
VALVSRIGDRGYACPIRRTACQLADSFPIGADVRLDQLEGDPHALFARLRADEPVSWLPALDGWLITRYDLALAAVRDAEAFTVDDPRFSTAQVVGPSMLSLDGRAHARHRAPFSVPFKPAAVRTRFSEPVLAETEALIDAIRGQSSAELRRGFAGPLAARIVSHALGLGGSRADELLTWYDQIVAGVTSITAGEPTPAGAQAAFAALSGRLRGVIDGADRTSLLASAAADAELSPSEVVSNAAVLLFGGIETTEGMICNALLALVEHPDALDRVRDDPSLLDAAIEESLRLEPAAAVLDRYATDTTQFGGATIGAGELVRISIAAANRDPSVFANPDRFDLERSNHRRHLAFAHGPHVCLGVHLARLEARTAIARLLAAFPDIRPNPARRASVSGLVFRKPRTLHVLL